MLTAAAMTHFENEIARAVVLALFIPLIISTGGNSGSQSAAFVIRSLALGELTRRDWRRVLVKEFSSGVILGFTRFIPWHGWLLPNHALAEPASDQLRSTLFSNRRHSVAESHWRGPLRNGSRKHVASHPSLGWL